MSSEREKEDKLEEKIGNLKALCIGYYHPFLMVTKLKKLLGYSLTDEDEDLLRRGEKAFGRQPTSASELLEEWKKEIKIAILINEIRTNDSEISKSFISPLTPQDNSLVVHVLMGLERLEGIEKTITEIQQLLLAKDQKLRIREKS